MMKASAPCTVCNHEEKWHRDGSCQAYTCKHRNRFPAHEFNGVKKRQGKLL